tara:strand:- start:28811 stop:29275 length:465 start_codon:yes stop_codon:yes gene_type:complete
MENTMSDIEAPVKYRNPIWQNKDNRHLVCELLQSDGEYLIAHIIAGPEDQQGVNADYDAIIADYGLDELDKRTIDHKESNKKAHQTKKEHEEAKRNREVQELLFNMKIEAFEIPSVKASKNKTLKKLIRKSKTPIEIQAYTTILIARELEKNAE